MFVRKIKGEWFVCCGSGKSGKAKQIHVRDIFLVKTKDSGSGYINGSSVICCSKELVGKRVRIKLEVLEE